MTRLVAIVVLAVSFQLAGQLVAAPPNEGAYYKIKNVNSKKALALNDGAEDGAQIIQRSPGQNERQQWSFVRVGKFYRIVNRKSGQALNVQSKEDGTPVIASDNGKNLQWSLEETEGGFIIKSRHSGLVLDVANEAEERKAEVIQYPFHDGRNQIFEIELVEE